MTKESMQALETLKQAGNVLYDRAVLDGVLLIKNMLDEKPEGQDEWTVDLIKETINEFVANNQTLHMEDEKPSMPEEYKGQGLEEEDFGDLMDLIDSTESEVEEPEEVEVIDGSDIAIVDQDNNEIIK